MLRYDCKDRVAEVVVDRAEAGNAFTGEMVRRLGDILRTAAQDADIVALTGAGGDFTLGRDRNEPKTGTPFEAFRHISALNQAITAYPGILIAGVRGRAFGLGVGLIMRSDIAIAASDATLALDEVSLGIPPMFIMEEIIEHLPSKRALDLVLTSREVGAEEALQMGLLSRVVPAESVGTAISDYVATLRGRDRDVIRACKKYMRAAAKMPADARSAFALVEQTHFAMSKH
jgi:enoyl-CoA hydratase/carnithine racemase